MLATVVSELLHDRTLPVSYSQETNLVPDHGQRKYIELRFLDLAPRLEHVSNADIIENNKRLLWQRYLAYPSYPVVFENTVFRSIHKNQVDVLQKIAMSIHNGRNAKIPDYLV